MCRSLVEITAEIVLGQAREGHMGVSELTETISAVFSTLKMLKQEENAGYLPIEDPISTTESEANGNGFIHTISAKKSIQKNKIICMECGQESKVLHSKHLNSHGLTPKEYRKKWGFSGKQALSCRSISEKKREVALKHDLGGKLANYRQKRAEAKSLI